MSEVETGGAPGPAGADGTLDCGGIRDVLFGYMTRELGSARSTLVREHIRKCPDCQAAAAEIQATLNLLREASGSGEATPPRLSEERRRRLRWAYTHPVLHWIERRHVLVSLLAALVVVALALAVLRGIRGRPGPPPEGIPVNIAPLSPQGPTSHAPEIPAP